MQTVDTKIMQLKPGDRILDLGCGEGRHVHNFHYYHNVYALGVDLSLKDLLSARRRIRSMPAPDKGSGRPRVGLVVADALYLPFVDDSFDQVVCSEVLEHIPDYRSALREIARVLRPGGVFAASVPRFFPEWLCWQLSVEYRNEPGGHVRIFRSGALKNAVEAEGFICFERHWAHGLHSPYWWLRCLLYKSADKNSIVKAYHRFLVWDMMKRPLLTRILETIAAPVMGKSVVMYFTRTNYDHATPANS